jgi:hypothetical protein
MLKLGSKLVLPTLLATLVASVCWLSQARAAIVSTTLDCVSEGDAYTECDAGNVFTDAKIISETVAGSCVFGSTWGTYDHFIWVNHGCSGRFTVSTATTSPIPTPTHPPVCKVVDCRFNSVNWQPYARESNHFIGLYHFGFQDPNTCQLSIQMAHSQAICNWVGNGFTPYDIETNAEVIHWAYPTLDACYASLP